jgi:hypothetical protein
MMTMGLDLFVRFGGFRDRRLGGPGICVPTQISQPSLVTCTVQFMGSIVACARKGCW